MDRPITPLLARACKMPTEAEEDWMMAVKIVPAKMPSTGLLNWVSRLTKASDSRSGAMAALTRLRSGMFAAEDSLTLAQIEELACQGGLDARIMPVDQFFGNYPEMRLDRAEDARAHNGNPLPWREYQESRVRVYDSEGRFIGVYEKDEKTHTLKPWKMFYRR